MTSSEIADGSWELTIVVAELALQKTLRVKGDLHIGGLMVRLVEALEVSMDWSDHGFWWSEKNVWLLRTHLTLDQYGVQSDVILCFTPMHNNLRIQLPDLQTVDLKVNFSLNVFSVVIRICKELGIRHPEELSLARKLEAEELKRNKGVSATRRARPPGGGGGSRSSTGGGGGGGNTPGGHHLSNSSLLDTNSTFSTSPRRFAPGRRTPGGTLMRTCSSPISPFGGGGGGGGGRSPYSPGLFNANSSFSPGSVSSLFFGTGALESVLANSPALPTSEGLRLLYRPKNLSEKARINAGWLDSSRSLMEQGISANCIVLLRFKFFNFYDLNPRYDHVRINQLYEQAKWSLLSEELDCTFEEMITFAAIQLQVQIQSQVPQDANGSVARDDEGEGGGGGGDRVDAALDDLQMALEGDSTTPNADITQVPELCDYLRFYKRKRFWFQSYRRHYFVFRDTCLSMYRTSVDRHLPPQWTVNLKGCEVTSEILVTSSKYNIKLQIPSPGGMLELWLKADSDEQYVRWMAAFRLACKGKTMADSAAFEYETRSITSLVNMQRRPVTSSPSHTSTSLNVQPEDYVAPRFLKKLRAKQLIQRILDAHSSVQELNLVAAKLSFVRAWQALPEHGLAYFIVKFKGNKREELLGIAFNQMLRMTLQNGDLLKTWRYQNMRSWSVNWETKQVQVSFEEDDLVFQCMTADCKVVHEFIGGYIFLSMRSGNRNQMLHEELFHKLTGGWL